MNWSVAAGFSFIWVFLAPARFPVMRSHEKLWKSWKRSISYSFPMGPRVVRVRPAQLFCGCLWGDSVIWHQRPTANYMAHCHTVGHVMLIMWEPTAAQPCRISSQHRDPVLTQPWRTQWLLLRSWAKPSVFAVISFGTSSGASLLLF